MQIVNYYYIVDFVLIFVSFSSVGIDYICVIFYYYYYHNFLSSGRGSVVSSFFHRHGPRNFFFQKHFLQLLLSYRRRYHRARLLFLLLPFSRRTTDTRFQLHFVYYTFVVAVLLNSHQNLKYLYYFYYYNYCLTNRKTGYLQFGHVYYYLLPLHQSRCCSVGAAEPTLPRR